MNVDHEVTQLVKEIERLGTKGPDGKCSVKYQFICLFLRTPPQIYGVLFNDDTVGNTFESLMGTLKAAKKRKLLTYDGEILLQRVHDNVDVKLL